MLPREVRLFQECKCSPAMTRDNKDMHIETSHVGCDMCYIKAVHYYYYSAAFSDVASIIINY